MRTDLPMNLDSSGRTAPRKVVDIVPGRVERRGGGEGDPKVDSREGRGNAETRAPASFEETYRKVADENRQAKRVTEDTTKMSDGAEVKRIGREDKRKMDHGANVEDENALAALTADMFEGVGADGQLVSNEPAAQATVMIRQSLTVIKEVFQLNIVGPIEELDLSDPSDETLDQFAEILSLLKSIVGILDEAVREGVAIEVQGQRIEPSDMVTMERTLRVEMFRMQMAFEKVGIAGDVSALLAQKLDQPFSQGIPQAIDLSTLTAPRSIVEMFEEVVNAKTEDIQAIVARMAALAQQKGTVQIATQGSVRIMTAETEKKVADIGAFGASVLRTMLKIEGDMPALTDEQAGNDTESNLGRQARSMTLGSVTPGQLFREVLDLTTQEADGAVLQGQRGAAPAGPEQVPRPLAMPFRNIEESVMRQVTERFHHAIRTGATEVRVLLRPESLGQVQLKIQMDGDVVMAKIHVESAQVKQIMESNLQSLRNALQEHNLQAGSFDVDVNSGSARFAAEDGEGSGRSRGSTREDNEDGTGDEPVASVAHAKGVDTGRRFGTNSFEYFG